MCQSQADTAKFGLQGTPTFFMGGKMLEAHSWPGIQTELDKLF